MTVITEQLWWYSGGATVICNVTGIEDLSVVKNHETLKDYGMDSFTTKEVEKVIKNYGVRMEGDLKDTSFGSLRQVFMQNIWYFVSNCINIFEFGNWNVYKSHM